MKKLLSGLLLVLVGIVVRAAEDPAVAKLNDILQKDWQQHKLAEVPQAPDHVFLRRIMLEQAKTRVLLCDHTKFDQVSTCRLFGFELVDYLVTDRKPDDSWIELLTQKGVKLLYP